MNDEEEKETFEIVKLVIMIITTSILVLLVFLQYIKRCILRKRKGLNVNRLIRIKGIEMEDYIGDLYIDLIDLSKNSEIDLSSPFTEIEIKNKKLKNNSRSDQEKVENRFFTDSFHESPQEIYKFSKSLQSCKRKIFSIKNQINVKKTKSLRASKKEFSFCLNENNENANIIVYPSNKDMHDEIDEINMD